MRKARHMKRVMQTTAKPRNPVAAALATSVGARGSGVHGKTRAAQRRRDKIALAKEPTEE